MMTRPSLPPLVRPRRPNVPNTIRHLGIDTIGAEFDVTLRPSFVIENGKASMARLLRPASTIEGARRP